MKITVRVITNARDEGIIFADGVYKIKVKTRPIAGAANERLIEMLAEYFNTTKSNITVRSGHTSKNKIIEII